MARRKSRLLSQGPFAPPEKGEAGPPPPWWPDWMPWIDLDAWRAIFRQYNKFVTEGREAPTAQEAVQNMSDFLEDWYKKARQAIEERMK